MDKQAWEDLAAEERGSTSALTPTKIQEVLVYDGRSLAEAIERICDPADTT